jgi:nucleotide-binding universal stress UspA family protein
MQNAKAIKFTRIATAMGFSPMAKANLAEVHRISKKVGAQFYVFHIGVWDQQCETTYLSFLQELSIGVEEVHLVSKNGDPKVELLALCQEHKIELLALGALIRESMFKVLTASIARDICRKAKLSLLLLTHSRTEALGCDRVVVNGLDHPKTPDTLKTALWFTSKLKSKELFVVDELSEKQLVRPDDDKSSLRSTRRRKQIEREQHGRLEALLAQCEVPVTLEMKEQHVFGTRGYTIAHFAKAQKADLLIVNSPDTKLGIFDRIFKHDLEYILADLPTDVLIVHSTKELSNA